MRILVVMVVKCVLVRETSEGCRESYSQGDGGMFDFDDLDEAEVLDPVVLRCVKDC